MFVDPELSAVARPLALIDATDGTLLDQVTPSSEKLQPRFAFPVDPLYPPTA